MLYEIVQGEEISSCFIRLRRLKEYESHFMCEYRYTFQLANVGIGYIGRVGEYYDTTTDKVCNSSSGLQINQ